MKKEIAVTERPEIFTEQYLAAFGNMSWYDFVTAMPSLVFVVTGWKSNGKKNACLHSWSSFAGSGADNFICILGKVNKDGHMYQSLKETKACVLNFPSNDIYDRCIKTIGNNQFETDEITASGLTAGSCLKVNAPRIKECFLNIECEFLWEHELFEGSREAAVALKRSISAWTANATTNAGLADTERTCFYFRLTSRRIRKQEKQHPSARNSGAGQACSPGLRNEISERAKQRMPLPSPISYILYASEFIFRPEYFIRKASAKGTFASSPLDYI